MLRLMLLRHAKSGWPTDTADRDRPLASRGREAAPAMGRHLAEADLNPDLVLVSPARRTLETWELVAAMLAEKPAYVVEPRIYEAKASRLLDVVREVEGPVGTLLLIGHNPGLEDLAGLLAGAGERSERARMHAKYPTAGLAVIDFDLAHWRELKPGTGRLERFVTPASLGEGPDE